MPELVPIAFEIPGEVERPRSRGRSPVNERVPIDRARPAELAHDDTPTLPVLQHAVRWHEEAIGKRVVALDDDTIGIRTMGNVVMSFDHRIMDGATAAAFLRDVKAWIQGVDPSNVALS